MSFLTTLPHDPLLDLDAWVGQRQCTFRFHLINGVTRENLGEITPIRGASLTHDTTRTIKRQLDLSLGVVDTAAINVVTDRVSPFMVFPNGQEYPLGTYMFTDASREVFTSAPAGIHTAGGLANVTLNDEMVLVDQQIIAGINGVGQNTNAVIQEALAGLPISYTLDPSPYQSVEAWGVGTNRGQVLEALSLTGDYFSPWFGNDSKLHFIRTFDPATQVPSFNFDVGNKVIREPILETDDLLTAPNTFVVISNSATDPSVAVVGTATVPTTAPHSVANRGFAVTLVKTLQLSDNFQATATAQGLANRQTVFERVSLTTAPDPRHDSYNVIRWQGTLWLELAWSMSMVEGGAMNHLLRKSYRP
jgi:hypothetical protein